MAVGNVIFAVLTALVAVNFTFAEENPLELGDIAYDQVDGNENYGPPSKVNDNEKTQEGEMSPLSRSSIKIRCEYRQGSDYCVSCSKVRHCVFAIIGFDTTCGHHQPYCNEGKCSNIPGSKCL